jgi:hypothetical protein
LNFETEDGGRKTEGGRKRLPSAKRVRVVAALLALTLAAAPLAAQRGEIAVLGGTVLSPDVEFDRVTSTTLGPPSYTRERGRRESGPALGVAATFAIRGHVFAELGIMHHGVERSISRTGTGDANGPFIQTTTTSGTITTLWVGPAYRVVDRERFALTALAAPVLHVLQGRTFEEATVNRNAPTTSTALGLMLGLRARYWFGEQVGLQLAVEDAMWTFPLSPHPSDGTPAYPETYRDTPRQHDLRLHLGLAFKLF